ncbi:MAG: TonB-dependent receptor [Saprospiraceae bacterium]|nr:TonB-dependent receptor [Saprospiraceae bacterium]
MLNYSNFLKLFYVICIVCNFAYSGYTQNIKLPSSVNTLHGALIYLNKNYDVAFSCNDTWAKECKIDTSLIFKNVRDAISKLTKSCKLKFKRINRVYVILKPELSNESSNIISQKRSSKNYSFKGYVIDVQTKEPLPFSSISIGISQLTTDESGFFNYKCSDSVVNVRIEHLGYNNFQGPISSSEVNKIGLRPSVNELQTVTVEASQNTGFVETIDPPGIIKLNDKLASLLPNNGNNSLFALLRLQAGVLAAGEQTNDFIIWGSYKGQSQIRFDGITIFNSSSYNDNIGAINPLFIQDVEIHKGGYQVHLGDRVGSVVSITSKSGSIDKYGGALSLCNQSVSGRVNIPIAQTSSLQLSLRSTFPNIFDPGTYNADTSNNFYFGDANLKYTLPLKNGDNFKISVLGNLDNYDSKSIELNSFNKYFSSIERNRQQFGASVFWGKKWEKAGQTNFTTAYSFLSTQQENELIFEDFQVFGQKFIQSNFTKNTISEYYVKADHHLPATHHQAISFGLRGTYMQSTFLQDSSGVTSKNTLSSSYRMSTYIKDNISINKFVSIQPGFRFDILLSPIVQPFIQPRIDVVVKPLRNLMVKLAYGIYNQYLVEYTVVDNLSNQIYYWDIPGNKGLEPLQGMHYVAALSYGQQFFNFEIEGYYKTISNLSRFVFDSNKGELVIQNGDARIYGVDMYFNTTFKGQRIWFVYSLTKTEERFGKMVAYQRAIHDQRHEIKMAGLFRIKPIYFSINYVFGTGFPNPNNLVSEENIRVYSRLDIAIMARHEAKKYTLESGLSVLNVLNTRNISFNNFSNFPDGSTRFSRALPITPTLFINVNF